MVVNQNIKPINGEAFSCNFKKKDKIKCFCFCLTTFKLMSNPESLEQRFSKWGPGNPEGPQFIVRGSVK